MTDTATKVTNCERCNYELDAGGWCPACTFLVAGAGGEDPKDMTPEQRAAELEMWASVPLRVPFDKLHGRIERLAGRPVWTHELARPDLIAAQIRGEREWKGPIGSFEEVAPGKPVIVVMVDDE